MPMHYGVFSLFPYEDKVIHFFLYGLLATHICRMPRQFERRISYQHAIFTIALTALYGLTDEIHQYYTPFRSFDLLDWLADILGGVTAVFFYQRWAFYRQLLEYNLRLISGKSA
jgi:VanZ family protein